MGKKGRKKGTKPPKSPKLPDAQEVWDLATEAYKRGEHEQALAQFAEAAELANVAGPRSHTKAVTMRARCFTGAASCHLALDDRASALTAAKVAVALNPSDAAALASRATVHLTCGRWAAAAADYEAALAHQPSAAAAAVIATQLQRARVHAAHHAQLLVEHSHLDGAHLLESGGEAWDHRQGRRRREAR